MSDARANILARLRRIEPAAGTAPERPVEQYDWNREQRIARFTEKMQAVRTEIHRVAKSDWPAKLQALAADKGLSNLLCAPSTPHGRTLAAAATEAGPALIAYEQNIEDWKDRLFNDIDAAITGSRAAIAETGSLILWPDAREPRLMSLVPPVHIVLLDVEQLYSTFAEAVEAQHWANGMPTNALLISGPSKSADIEQTLAYGVHGPKELIVLMIE